MVSQTMHIPCVITYKFMHLIKRYNKLIIGHSIHNTICALSLTATTLSITLTHTNYITW